jgi:hypothetical protein
VGEKTLPRLLPEPGPERAQVQRLGCEARIGRASSRLVLSSVGIAEAERAHSLFTRATATVHYTPYPGGRRGYF